MIVHSHYQVRLTSGGQTIFPTGAAIGHVGLRLLCAPGQKSLQYTMINQHHPLTFNALIIKRIASIQIFVIHQIIVM